MNLKENLSFAVPILAITCGSILVGLPFIAQSGAHGTTISISTVGKWVIATAIALPALASFLWIVARPQRELILSAALRSPPRAAGFSIFVGAFVGLFAYLWLRLAIPYLPASQAVEHGELIQIYRHHVPYAKCDHEALVRQQDGTEITICLERGWVFKTYRTDVDCLRPGDTVTIFVRSSFLGNSAILDRARCR